MFKKKIYAVIDVETAGSIGFPLIYDLAVSVCDKKGNISHSQRWIIEDIFTNKSLMDSAFYGAKRPIYWNMLATRQAVMVSFKQAMFELNQIFRKFGVDVISAYNLQFDLRALNSTQKFTKLKWKYSENLFWKDYAIQDIWGLACETVYQTVGFENFIRTHGLFTEKGNPKTSAEMGFRFVTNDNNFQEAHTALEDTVIECKILARALRMKKGYTKGIFGCPWRKVANKFKRE